MSIEERLLELEQRIAALEGSVLGLSEDHDMLASRVAKNNRLAAENLDEAVQRLDRGWRNQR